MGIGTYYHEFYFHPDLKQFNLAPICSSIESLFIFNPPLDLGTKLGRLFEHINRAQYLEHIPENGFLSTKLRMTLELGGQFF